MVISINKPFPDKPVFSQALLYVYEWKGSTFSSNPMVSIALTDEESMQYIKNVSVLDLNADGKDEIAVALSGSEPIISILGITGNETPEFYEIQSFLMESFLTTPKYCFLFLSDTNGTDQNCLVFLHLLKLHPNTNVYTPITNLSFTEFRYSVTTGNIGAPCVMYVLTFLSLRNGLGYAYSLVKLTNLYANPGVNTSSKKVSILGTNLNHHTGDIKYI